MWVPKTPAIAACGNGRMQAPLRLCGVQVGTAKWAVICISFACSCLKPLTCETNHLAVKWGTVWGGTGKPLCQCRWSCGASAWLIFPPFISTVVGSRDGIATEILLGHGVLISAVLQREAVLEALLPGEAELVKAVKEVQGHAFEAGTTEQGVC